MSLLEGGGCCCSVGLGLPLSVLKVAPKSFVNLRPGNRAVVHHQVSFPTLKAPFLAACHLPHFFLIFTVVGQQLRMYPVNAITLGRALGSVTERFCVVVLVGLCLPSFSKSL